MEAPTTARALIRVDELRKSFRMGSERLEVLRGASFDLYAGEILTVVGQSGSGKSTLLHQVGLLDASDSGSVRYRDGLLPLSGPGAAYARNRLFGFVFQFYHLLPEFTALENVLMPALILRDWGAWRRQKGELRARARDLLARVGLEGRMRHKPPQLSGGERQRVAIARALMNAPEVLLCDEPTGNLDRHTAESIRDLLWDLNRDEGQTMIVVTHDAGLARRADRTLRLVDGRLEPLEEAA